MSKDCVGELRQWMAGLLGGSNKQNKAVEEAVVCESAASPSKQEVKDNGAQPPTQKKEITVTNIDPIPPGRSTESPISRSFLTSQITTKRGPTTKAPNVLNGAPPKCLKLEGSEREFSLGSDSMFVGKEQMNDICLPEDGAIQGTHALITKESGQYWIANKALGHKIKLNDDTIKMKTPFRTGDQLRIGNQILKAE